MIKDNLSAHLSNFPTAPFLFVGAGMSRRYLGAENWEELLMKFAARIEKDYQYYYSASNGDFPTIGSTLAHDFFEKWWNEESFQESRERNRAFAIDRESPLKIEISDYISQISNNLTNDESLLEEITLLKDANVDGIITTNYDLFLENTFNQFKPFVGQNDLLFSVAQGIGEIYKIHGCCTNPNSLVLTKENYEDFNQRSKYLAAKLLTVFTEHPVIFLGYSLGDKNITTIIQSITDCLTNSNISELQDRLIFVEYSKEAPSFTKTEILVNGLQIPITKIQTESFIPIFESLTTLKRKFPVKFLRKLKEQIYELIRNTDENHDKIYSIDIDADSDFANLDVVLGIGIAKDITNMAVRGYAPLRTKDLFEDIIRDNGNYDSKKIIEKVLRRLIVGNVKYVPIFKYLRDCNLIQNGQLENEDYIPPKVRELFTTIVNDPEAFFEKYVGEHKKEEILTEGLTLIECEEDVGREVLKYAVSFPELRENSDSLQKIAEKYLLGEIESDNIQQDFKSLVCFYDYLKYYKQV